jgi:hypothetical protein
MHASRELCYDIFKSDKVVKLEEASFEIFGPRELNSSL